ncbi:MFS transporter [Pararhodobacter sp. CCB-MM2]|uniref:MFS transporter n=1 Tax=Pararhodobacter sp. CCB-MM2 TaxID=1786003 RepID=UPI00082CBDC1|nr:MFS transporter [Pararhodobacter sp. CCB-MM2]
MARIGSFLRENALWLGCCALISFLSSFGQTFFISVFAGDIRAEFGLSHAGWGGVYATATTVSALVMVFAGGVSDWLRVRYLGPLVLLALSAAALAMSQVSALWALGVTVFFLRFLGQGMMSHTALTAVARWFVASRGRAVAVVTLGFAIGEAFLPMSFVALKGLYDWRLLWVGAAIALALMAPVIWALLSRERTPQSFAAQEGASGMGGRMWTRAEVLRDPLFWLMIPALMGPPTWNTAFFFHQVHLAEVKDWGHATLVSLFPFYTATGVAAALGSGWLIDRIGTARMLPFYLLGLAAGYAVFAMAETPLMGALGLMLMGVSVGMHGTIMSTLWADAYGTRHIGSIRALLGGVMVLGSAIGPGLTGALIDQGVDYAQQGWGVSAYFLIATLLAAAAARRMAGS